MEKILSKLLSKLIIKKLGFKETKIDLEDMKVTRIKEEEKTKIFIKGYITVSDEDLLKLIAKY